MAEKKIQQRMEEISRIIHGAFVQEGTMVAFPLCFPGVTVPIPPEESRITALALSKDGMVYGGTSGRKTHLFCGIFGGATGMVLDMGTVEGGGSCTGVFCGEERLVAAVNGPTGGRIISRRLEPKLPWDLIQEWGIFRYPYENWGLPDEGAPILHLAGDQTRNEALCLTTNQLFRISLDTGKMKIIGDIQGKAKLIADNHGNFYGLDGDHALWQYNLDSSQLISHAWPLPSGQWQREQVTWAKDVASNRMYIADNNGRIFAFIPGQGFTTILSQTPLTPVISMAVTSDGRLFGFCGKELATLFCYTPQSGVLRDIGKAVSVIERRRYGYEFADAVTGPDGQIYFAENDNLGHLWIYFPAIEPYGSNQ